MIDRNLEKKSLSAGELAKAVGVSTDTLRHYESKGVIQSPPRRANGYRLYPPGTLARVQLIRSALAIGFTLDELSAILHERDLGGAPCRKVRDLAAGKLAQLEERMRELAALRRDLLETLQEWDTRLARVSKHRRADLLESLKLPRESRPKRRAPFTSRAKPKRKDEE